MANILYLEDDPILGESMSLNIELEGNTVTWVKSFSEASSLQKVEDFDVAILDLNLPDGNGLDFCKNLRAKGHKFPIIILTAQLDEDVVVDCLTSGANDYVKKPFSHKELFARLGVCLRVPYKVEDKVHFANLSLVLNKRELKYKGRSIAFNRKEFELLKVFFQRADSVVTREQLIQAAGFSEDIIDRTIDSHLSHIRTKFKKEKITSVKIKSEYGVGYRMVAVES